jgi:hypothetical protein
MSSGPGKYLKNFFFKINSQPILCFDRIKIRVRSLEGMWKVDRLVNDGCSMMNVGCNDLQQSKR